MPEKTASVTKLRENLSAYLEDLPPREALMVLRHNDPVADILSPAHYHSLIEKLAALEDIRDMLEALKDFAEGEEFHDANDFFEELGL